MAEFEVSFYKWDPKDFNESFKFDVTVRNESSSDFAGGHLLIDSSNYFQASSAPLGFLRGRGGSQDISVPALVRGGLTVDDVPRAIRYTIVDKNNSKVYSSSINASMRLFSKRLYKYKPTYTPNYNILLFGLAGATKSSFINSILTLLSEGNEIEASASAGSGSRHNTTALTRFTLKDTKINLWDTWGLTKDTYEKGELDFILEGELPSNWKMFNSIEDFRQKIAANRVSREERRIHGILFFLPQAALMDPALENVRRLIKEYFAKFSQKGYSPIVMLTRVDEEEPKVREEPNGKFPKLEEIRKKAATILDIAPNKIFYNINYLTESKKSFEIDRMNFKILDQVVRYAQGYCDTAYQTEVAQNDDKFEW